MQVCYSLVVPATRELKCRFVDLGDEVVPQEHVGRSTWFVSHKVSSTCLPSVTISV